jgi:drug/metabolite transporter (DMT)-like permease
LIFPEDFNRGWFALGVEIKLSKKWLREVVLLIVVTTWGMNYTIGKYGVVQLSPLLFNALRFIITAPVLMFVVYITERSLRVERRDIVRLICVSLVGITLYQTFFMTSVQYTSATSASLLIAMSPIFTGLFSVLLKQERFEWVTQIGSIISFCGAALVLLSENSSKGIYPHQLLGDIVGLFASICWGLYPVLANPLVQKYSSLKVTAWSSLIGVVPLLVLAVKPSLTVNWNLSIPTWFSLLYSTFIVSVFGLVAWYACVRQIGPTKVMVYMYLVPLVAVVFARFYIHEGVSWGQIIGGITILVGISVVKGLIRIKRTVRIYSRDENVHDAQ